MQQPSQLFIMERLIKLIFSFITAVNFYYMLPLQALLVKTDELTNRILYLR